MNITFNGKEIVSDSVTLSELLAELDMPATGIAVAVNNDMVRKDRWDSFALKENDKVLVIRAACGG